MMSANSTNDTTNTQTHTFSFLPTDDAEFYTAWHSASRGPPCQKQNTRTKSHRVHERAHMRNHRVHIHDARARMRAPSSITFVRHRTQGTARRYQYRSQAVSQDEKRFNYLISEGHRGGVGCAWPASTTIHTGSEGCP